MYKLLGRSWASNPARCDDASSYDRQDVWWNNGARFTKQIRTPIEVCLTPYELQSPDKSQKMPLIFNKLIPIWRDDLIAAMQAGGVDNLDLYEPNVIDPDDGSVNTNYKAVNIIGLVAAAGMAVSQAVNPDGIPLKYVSFDKFVIDSNKALGLLVFRLAENNSAVLVHKRLRDYLMSRGFTELIFYITEEIALP